MIDIDIFLNTNVWDCEEIENYISTDILEHVQLHLNHCIHEDMRDKPWWIKTSLGKFIVRNAWDFLRKKEEKFKFFKKI